MKTQERRERSHLLYEGKCKKIFHIKNRPEEVWIEFKDTLTAFNGKKKSSFEGKGQLNRNTSSLIFKYLDLKGILNHWICNEGESGHDCSENQYDSFRSGGSESFSRFNGS